MTPRANATNARWSACVSSWRKSDGGMFRVDAAGRVSRSSVPDRPARLCLKGTVARTQSLHHRLPSCAGCRACSAAGNWPKSSRPARTTASTMREKPVTAPCSTPSTGACPPLTQSPMWRADVGGSVDLRHREETRPAHRRSGARDRERARRHNPRRDPEPGGKKGEHRLT